MGAAPSITRDTATRPTAASGPGIRPTFGALRPDLPIYALAFVIAGALNLWMVHVARSWRRAERELLADAQS